MIPSFRSCRWGCRSAPTVVSKDWFDWPALPDLFPASFPGVKTSRDPFLVDVDTDQLKRGSTITSTQNLVMRRLLGAIRA